MKVATPAVEDVAGALALLGVVVFPVSSNSIVKG